MARKGLRTGAKNDSTLNKPINDPEPGCERLTPMRAIGTLRHAETTDAVVASTVGVALADFTIFKLAGADPITRARHCARGVIRVQR
jgi:hypothetical protein